MCMYAVVIPRVHACRDHHVSRRNTRADWVAGWLGGWVAGSSCMHSLRLSPFALMPLARSVFCLLWYDGAVSVLTYSPRRHTSTFSPPPHPHPQASVGSDSKSHPLHDVQRWRDALHHHTPTSQPSPASPAQPSPAQHTAQARGGRHARRHTSTAPYLQ